MKGFSIFLQMMMMIIIMVLAVMIITMEVQEFHAG
jgi:hypothetical protein